MASANVGGTPGWKANRANCPVCKRDCAVSPPYPRDPYYRIKAHGPVRARCRGVGRVVSRDAVRIPSTSPADQKEASDG